MLELKNIYKTFNPGTINEKRALNGLNLKLNEGDCNCYRRKRRRQIYYAKCCCRNLAG